MERLNILFASFVFQIERIDVTFWEVTKPELYSMENGFPAFLFYTPLGKKEWDMYGFPIFEYPGMVKVCTQNQIFYIFHVLVYTYTHTPDVKNNVFCDFCNICENCFFFLQIVSHEGTKIKDPDNREEEKKDDTIIKRTQKIIKSMFRGMKTEPSIVETCIYTVS